MKKILVTILFPTILLLIRVAAGQAAPGSLDDQLIAAAKSSATATVQQLLQQGAKIEAEDKNGWTPLIWAAYEGKVETAKLLLDKGANIEAKAVNGETALMRADSADVVKLLLDRGANIETKDNTGDTALMRTANSDLVKLLLDRGANIEAINNGGFTALILASDEGNSGAVGLLLDRGANVEARDKYGCTALIWAAYEGRADVVKLLLGKGANVETKATVAPFDGWTALTVAAERGHADVVKLLQDKGTGIEAMNTTLVDAAGAGHADVVKLLLDKGANVEARDKLGNTALLATGNPEVVKLLFAKGANIDDTDNDGWSALMHAAQNGNVEVVKVLLDKGANIEATAKENPYKGDTALILASRQGKADVVKVLLDKGANIETKDNDGWTPLIMAARNAHSEVVKVLLDKGANIEAKDQYGDTALALAKGLKNAAESSVRQYPGDQMFKQVLSNDTEVLNLLEQAVSATPQTTFSEAVVDLQQRSSDDARREKVVELAAGLSTLPPVPDEAKQLFLQASALIKTSTPENLYKPIDLLQKALVIAPWWANAYYNLSRAQELSRHYDEAAKQLNYYLELKPSGADAADARTKIAVIQSQKEAAARKKQGNESVLAVKYASGGVTRLRFADAPEWWHGSINTLYGYWWVPEEEPFYANVFRMPNGKLLAIILVAQSNNGAYAGDEVGVYDITDNSCIEGNDFAFGAQRYAGACGGRYYVSVSDQPNATVTITYPATGASVTLPVALLYRGRALKGTGIFGGCSGTVHQGGSRAMVLSFDCSLVEAAKDPTVNAAGLTPTTVKPE